MVSLLYLYPEAGSPIECLRDLGLEQIVSRICRDSDFASFILETLGKPLQNQANVTYRQEIYRDFIDNSGLFQELSVICQRYSKLISEWDKEIAKFRTQTGKMQFDAAHLDNIRDVVYTLEANATYSVKITSVPEALVNLLDKYTIKSQGLSILKRFCETRIQDENFIRLRQIAGELSEITTILDNGCEVTVDLNDSLYMEAVHFVKLIDGNQIVLNQPKPSFLASLLTPKNVNATTIEHNETVRIELGGDTTRELVAFIAEALKEVSSFLSNIVKRIYPVFASLAKELQFYNFALRLHQLYNEARVPICIPSIKPDTDDILQCEDLFDLLLVVKDHYSKRPRHDVVPNDVQLKQQICGILIKGNNNSGKTTFLRAIGIAQILAQAGLPIPALSAVISIRRSILTQFSSEDRLAVDGDAGRFEGEVREVAAIIERLEPYSLVLFNETFQTTAFDEAADAMFDILDIISQLGVKWIFVTHLLQLYDRFTYAKKDVSFLQTNTSREGRYKLVTVPHFPLSNL